MADIDRKQRAEKAYIRSNKTVADIADEFGVTARAVQKWIKQGDWVRKRAEYFGIDPENPGIPKTAPIAIGRKKVKLDCEALVIKAIEMLSVAASQTESKSLEAVLSTQLAFMKFYRQHNPLTVKDLVELAIANGLDFDAVMAELAKHREQMNAG